MNSERRWRRVLSISSPYLEPGKRVGRLAFAQTFNPLLGYSWVLVYPVELIHRSRWPLIVFGVGLVVLIVLGMTVLKRTGRIVVITDRRVLVWATIGVLGRGHEFLREFPRGTMVGPASGHWWNGFDTLGEHLYLA